MKLHFTDLDEFRIQALIQALETVHQITKSPDQIPADCDGLVIGVGATDNHPDVLRARDLGINIFSIPALIASLSEDKQRVVITGSTNTSLVAAYVIHVLETIGKEFDYAIWSPMNGMASVRLTQAALIIIEGEGEVSSFENDRPQFLGFEHHIALITGLKHQFKDHYPTFDEYVREYDRLADATPKGGTVVYCEDDDLVTVIGGKERADIKNIPYTAHAGKEADGMVEIPSDFGTISFPITGEGNFRALGAALALLKRLSVTEEQFYTSMKSYKPIL